MGMAPLFDEDDIIGLPIPELIPPINYENNFKKQNNSECSQESFNNLSFLDKPFQSTPQTVLPTYPKFDPNSSNYVGNDWYEAEKFSKWPNYAESSNVDVNHNYLHSTKQDGTFYSSSMQYVKESKSTDVNNFAPLTNVPIFNPSIQRVPTSLEYSNAWNKNGNSSNNTFFPFSFDPSQFNPPPPSDFSYPPPTNFSQPPSSQLGQTTPTKSFHQLLPPRNNLGQFHQTPSHSRENQPNQCFPSNFKQPPPPQYNSVLRPPSYQSPSSNLISDPPSQLHFNQISHPNDFQNIFPELPSQNNFRQSSFQYNQPHYNSPAHSLCNQYSTSIKPSTVQQMHSHYSNQTSQLGSNEKTSVQQNQPIPNMFKSVNSDQLYNPPSTQRFKESHADSYVHNQSSPQKINLNSPIQAPLNLNFNYPHLNEPVPLNKFLEENVPNHHTENNSSVPRSSSAFALASGQFQAPLMPPPINKMIRPRGRPRTNSPYSPNYQRIVKKDPSPKSSSYNVTYKRQQRDSASYPSTQSFREQRESTPFPDLPVPRRNHRDITQSPLPSYSRHQRETTPFPFVQNSRRNEREGTPFPSRTPRQQHREATPMPYIPNYRRNERESTPFPTKQPKGIPFPFSPSHKKQEKDTKHFDFSLSLNHRDTEKRPFQTEPPLSCLEEEKYLLEAAKKKTCQRETSPFMQRIIDEENNNTPSSNLEYLLPKYPGNLRTPYQTRSRTKKNYSEMNRISAPVPCQTPPSTPQEVQKTPSKRETAARNLKKIMSCPLESCNELRCRELKSEESHLNNCSIWHESQCYDCQRIINLSIHGVSCLARDCKELTCTDPHKLNSRPRSQCHPPRAQQPTFNTPSPTMSLDERWDDIFHALGKVENNPQRETIEDILTRLLP